MVEVDLIMVDAYSPYTAIVARPWLYAIGAVSFTLHLKVKYLSKDQVEKLMRSQSVVKQCMVAVIRYQTRGEPSTPGIHGNQRNPCYLRMWR